MPVTLSQTRTGRAPGRGAGRRAVGLRRREAGPDSYGFQVLSLNLTRRIRPRSHTVLPPPSRFLSCRDYHCYGDIVTLCWPSQVRASFDCVPLRILSNRRTRHSCLTVASAMLILCKFTVAIATLIKLAVPSATP